MAFTNTNVPAMWEDLVTGVRTSTQGPLYVVGQYREENGKGYRYVHQNDATVTVTAGSLAYFTGSTAWDVCMDVSDTDRNRVAGVYTAVIADGGYGWMQTKGQCTVATNGDDDIALGDAVIASAAGDGTADSTAQDTAPICKVVGWAAAADSDAANTVLTELTLD